MRRTIAHQARAQSYTVVEAEYEGEECQRNQRYVTHFLKMDQLHLALRNIKKV